MPRIVSVALLLVLTVASHAEKKEHIWSIGKILDTNQVSRYVGTVSNASASATSNGNYTSGNAYGSETPIYRVYDTLVVEGQDCVYFTSERLHWRWSKGAHVTVNNEIKYYVDGRKLHVLDQDGKEHALQITKTVKRETTPNPPAQTAAPSPLSAGVPVTVSSTPQAADIEVDGAFVGNTPSTITVTAGTHVIVVKKKGFAEWTRNISVLSGNINVNAELEVVKP